MLTTLLRAYAAGALFGAATLLFETWCRDMPAHGRAVAAYSLVAGVLAAATRSVLGILWPRSAARGATLALLGLFGLLQGLYFVNVTLLPSVHYLLAQSLAADAALVVAAAAMARLGIRLGVVHAAARGGALVAALGLFLLSGGVAVVAAEWPVRRPPPNRGGRGPHLLLVVSDSVRLDHMGLHGYGRPTSPGHDALEGTARVYERAVSASSWTVPSVEELLLRHEGGLAERLASRGYATACFTDNPHLGPGSPLTAGFDRVDRSVARWRGLVRGTVLGEIVERLDGGDDRRLVDRVLNWVRNARGPVFLYVHLMDSHTPYRFPPIDGRARPGRRIEFPRTGMEMTPEEEADVVARYDAGVRSADAQVARLVAAARGWGRPFLAVLSSDHGESLGDSGRWFHGGSLAPELLAIPLLVVGEGVVPGRVSGSADHASIPRTLLAAAGFEPSDPGSDLRTSDGKPTVEGGLANLRYRIGAGYKLVTDLSNGRMQLFDIVHDPGETHDLARERPRLVATLSKGLSSNGSAPQMRPEDLERLRALGYTGN